MQWGCSQQQRGWLPWLADERQGEKKAPGRSHELRGARYVNMSSVQQWWAEEHPKQTTLQGSEWNSKPQEINARFQLRTGGGHVGNMTVPEEEERKTTWPENHCTCWNGNGRAGVEVELPTWHQQDLDRTKPWDYWLNITEAALHPCICVCLCVGMNLWTTKLFSISIPATLISRQYTTQLKYYTKYT